MGARSTVLSPSGNCSLESVAVGSAKTRISNFHTICKRLIQKAFLFNIKQVREKSHQLISAVPDFHWDMVVTGTQLRGDLSRISQMAERRAVHQPTKISHAIWFKFKVPLRLSKY